MVDERVQALINAEIDGETLDAGQRAELEQALAASAEARKLRDDLRQLAEALDRMVEEPAPNGLREAILAAVRKVPAPKAKVIGFGAFQGRRRETLRFGGALAAGVALGAIGLYLLQPAHRGFDPAQLVGAMSKGQPEESETASVRIETPQVKGTVALLEGDGVLILQFDLESPGPVSVQADYAAAGLRLMGFAQGAVRDTDIHSAQGAVGYLSQGEQRFVVYLARSNPKGGEVRLSVQAAGAVVHETTLTVPARGAGR